MKLTKCYACFCGYTKCKKQRLPRKLKKRYKKLLPFISKYFHRGFMNFPSSCDLAEFYNTDKKLFPIIDKIKTYQKQIDFLFSIGETSESIYFDENGRLSWYWEHDSDYGGSSGLMPFCYSEEEAGGTWAFSELKSTLMILFEVNVDYKDFEFPREIISDLTLLKYLKNHLK